MSYLYVNEQGASIGIAGNRIEVKHKDGMLQSIPIETLETIQVFGSVQISTKCLSECLERGISVVYYSMTGRYYGRLISPSHVNVGRQRKQAVLPQNDRFCLDFSRQIIDAKIRNQIVILRRYARNQNRDISQAVEEMQRSMRKLKLCRDIPQLMGYEGIAARHYFHALGGLIRPEFYFEKRTRRPPRDAFNSMISLGYSILMNEIYGKLEGRGLDPYFGIMHSDKEKHPTLASDLMEEWRAVLVDATAMSLVNGGEIHPEQFYTQEDGGVYLTSDGFKLFIRKLENKLAQRNSYIQEEGEVNFRRALDIQTMAFCRAIEAERAELYHPVLIR